MKRALIVFRVEDQAIRLAPRKNRRSTYESQIRVLDAGRLDPIYTLVPTDEARTAQGLLWKGRQVLGHLVVLFLHLPEPI